MSNFDPMIDELIVYAERYAISRRSYANTSVAGVIDTAARGGQLSQKTIAVLLRDITEALSDESIPYPDQKQKWAETIEILKAARS